MYGDVAAWICESEHVAYVLSSVLRAVTDH